MRSASAEFASNLEGARTTDVTLVHPLCPFASRTGFPILLSKCNGLPSFPPRRDLGFSIPDRSWRLHEDEAGFRFDFSAPVLGARPYKKLVVGPSLQSGNPPNERRAFAVFRERRSPWNIRWMSC